MKAEERSLLWSHSISREVGARSLELREQWAAMWRDRTQQQQLYEDAPLLNTTGTEVPTTHTEQMRLLGAALRALQFETRLAEKHCREAMRKLHQVRDVNRVLSIARWGHTAAQRVLTCCAFWCVCT